MPSHIAPLPPLKNEAFALECRKKYEEQGLDIGPHNGEFAHCPTPRRFGGTEGVWLTHDDHMAQGLLQAEDFGTTCFHHGDTAAWVAACSPPEDLLFLWEKWRLHHNHIMAWNGVGATDRTRDTWLEERSRGGKTTFERGHGIWSADPETKAEWGRKGGSKNLGKKKPPGHKVGQATNRQRWQSLIDPTIISTAAGVVSAHKGRGWDTKARKRIE